MLVSPSAAPHVCFALKSSAGSRVCVLQQEVKLCDHEAEDPGPRAWLEISVCFSICHMFLEVVEVSFSPYESGKFCVLTDGGGGFFSAALTGLTLDWL